MDEIWERAVETALDGQTDHAEARSLTLDGAVKCVHGRLPPPGVLEKFQNLHHLSIANIGVSSLEQFPRLRNLQRLILSDNRIAGGLEYLVEAGLESLRDLDLSNNRIQYIDDLAPLAQLKLVSLDLYECPVTRVQDYRSRVFGLIKSLKYLDKMDAEENERPESDDEDEEEEEEDEDDPGSGEIDGEERPQMMTNGHTDGAEGIVDVDEDEESDADEETEITRQANGHSFQANGFRVQHVDQDDDDDDDEYEDELNDSGEEVDDDDEDEDDDDVVEVHGVGDSDEDGIEDDDDDDDDDDEEEEVDNDFAEPESTGRLTSTEGEIDAHEQGEEDDDEDDDDDNGETGEEEQGVEDDAGEFEDEEEGEDEDEEYGGGYLVQPVSQTEEHAAAAAGVSDMEHGNEENDAEDEVEDDGDEDVDVHPVASTSQACVKRKRNSDEEEDEDEDAEDEDAGGLTKKQR